MAQTLTKKIIKYQNTKALATNVDNKMTTYMLKFPKFDTFSHFIILSYKNIPH